MRIGIDYDNTFSADPASWAAAMRVMKAGGHEIIGVTARHPDMTNDMHTTYFNVCDEVIFTSAEFKRKFITDSGRKPIDVWIDDAPDMIVEPYQLIGHPL